jgi:hypothetical protein
MLSPWEITRLPEWGIVIAKKANADALILTAGYGGNAK